MTVASLARLQHQFDSAAYTDNKSYAIVVEANAGIWQPSEACASPHLWLLLYGQLRTFYWTQQNIASMASQSSGGCFFVAALAPVELCVPSDSNGTMCTWKGASFTVRKLNPDASSVSAAAPQLAQASRMHFNGRLAFATVMRKGVLNKYGNRMLSFYWHGVWAVAAWVISRDPHALQHSP